jgi:energy-coupling factor transporter transmembrane protein EcfT
MKAGYKLAGLAAFSIITVVLPMPWLAAMALPLIAFVLLSRASPIRLIRMLMPAIPFIVVIAVLQALLQEPGLAIVSAFRILLLYLAGSAITITTGEAELAGALEKALGIFGKTFASDMSTIMMLTIAFIPIVREEFEAIKMAQEARGVSFSGLKAIRGVISIAVPLLYSLADRADRIATAMEARGYGLDK